MAHDDKSHERGTVTRNTLRRRAKCQEAPGCLLGSRTYQAGMGAVAKPIDVVQEEGLFGRA